MNAKQEVALRRWGTRTWFESDLKGAAEVGCTRTRLKRLNGVSKRRFEKALDHLFRRGNPNGSYQRLVKRVLVVPFETAEERLHRALYR